MTVLVDRVGGGRDVELNTQIAKRQAFHIYYSCSLLRTLWVGMRGP